MREFFRTVMRCPATIQVGVLPKKKLLMLISDLRGPKMLPEINRTLR